MIERYSFLCSEAWRLKTKNCLSQDLLQLRLSMQMRACVQGLEGGGEMEGVCCRSSSFCGQAWPRRAGTAAAARACPHGHCTVPARRGSGNFLVTDAAQVHVFAGQRCLQPSPARVPSQDSRGSSPLVGPFYLESQKWFLEGQPGDSSSSSSYVPSFL